MRKLILSLILVLVCSPAFAGCDTDPDAVACYTFDETSGDAIDQTGNGNDCTLVNTPTQGASGRFGTAYDFDQASSEYLNCGDIDAIDTASSVTVTAWVNFDSATSDSYIFNNYEGSTNFDGVFFLRDDVGSGSTDAFTIIAAESGGTDSVRLDGTTDSAPASSWIHVAVVFTTGSSTGITLYVNGVEDPNSPANLTSVSAIDSAAQAMYIGANFSGGSTMDGRIDDVGIYNVALSSEKIDNIRTKGLLGYGFTPRRHH